MDEQPEAVGDTFPPHNPYLPDDMNHQFDLSDDPDRAAEQIGEQVAGWDRFLEEARRAPRGFFKSKKWVKHGQSMAEGLAAGIADGQANPAVTALLADLKAAQERQDDV